MAFIRKHLPGENPNISKNSVHGPGCPLNASFGRQTKHFEKERIGLKG